MLLPIDPSSFTLFVYGFNISDICKEKERLNQIVNIKCI